MCICIWLPSRMSLQQNQRQCCGYTFKHTSLRLELPFLGAFIWTVLLFYMTNLNLIIDQLMLFDSALFWVIFRGKLWIFYKGKRQNNDNNNISQVDSWVAALCWCVCLEWAAGMKFGCRAHKNNFCSFYVCCFQHKNLKWKFMPQPGHFQCKNNQTCMQTEPLQELIHSTFNHSSNKQ